MTKNDYSNIGDIPMAHKTEMERILTNYPINTTKQLWGRMGGEPFTKEEHDTIIANCSDDSEKEYKLLCRTREKIADIADENAYRRIVAHYCRIDVAMQENRLNLHEKDFRITIDVSEAASKLKEKSRTPCVIKPSGNVGVTIDHFCSYDVIDGIKS